MLTRQTWVRKPWTIFLAAGTLAAIYLFPIVRVLRRVGDEGILVDGAHRVLHGQIPGRDFFEQMGPGSFYLLAAFFRIFGESIGTARGLVLLTGVALTLLILYCARRVLTSPALPVLFTTLLSIPFYAVTSHHWDGNLFALAAFAAFLAWQSNRQQAALIASGVLCGVCACIHQPKGVLMCAALLFTICLLERNGRSRCVIPLLISFAFAPLLVCSFYASQGALGDLIYADFLWPAQHYSKINRVPYAFYFLEGCWKPYYAELKSGCPAPLAFLETAFLTAPFLLLIALPALLATAAAVLRRKAFSSELIPFWICGAALFLSEMHRADLIHIIYGCPIWLILLCALFSKTRFSLLPAALITVSLIRLGSMNLTVALQATTKIETRHGVIYGFGGEPGLAFLIAHTTPGEPTFVYSYYPMYYFLSGTENPTRFSAFIHGYNTPDEFHSAIESIESKRVRYVLWDTAITEKTLRRWFPAYTPPAARDQIIENYLLSHYHQVALEGDFRVLKRND